MNPVIHVDAMLRLVRGLTILIRYIIHKLGLHHQYQPDCLMFHWTALLEFEQIYFFDNNFIA